MMLRYVAVVVLLVAACGSDDEPACVVDGTYTVTGALESGNCGDPGGPVTDTFTTLPDGSVKLEIQGLPNLVPVGRMNGCTWTAAGAVTVADATTSEREGTLQYSYTFTRTGFSGILSQAIPPATSLPQGCRGTYRVTGTRR